MYSGLLLTRHSGNWLGAHQKFNKIAFRMASRFVNKSTFPELDTILHFEGLNGPDGLKYKSSGKDEPSHFYDPVAGRGAVLEEIKNHYKQLVKAIRKQDKVRAAFEASWLAHAITDGLTPAHHYPYESELHQLRGGELVEKFRDKMIIRGSSRTQTIRSTWKFIGAKGLLTTHLHFEIGVAAAVATWRTPLLMDATLLKRAKREGVVKLFQSQARSIAELKLYQRFAQHGWTVGLARAVRKQLAPTIAETIAAVWLLAYHEAGYKVRKS